MLKISARNCSDPDSPSHLRCVSLLSARSTVHRPGPRSIPLPAVPRVPNAEPVVAQVAAVHTTPLPAPVVMGDNTNMFGLNHCAGLCVMTLLASNGTG